MAAVGEASCRPVAACDLDPWAALASAVAIVHVDGSAPTGGDGSPQAPFSMLAEALTAAAPGSAIAIAPGDYDATLRIEGRSQSLWGTCPDEVRLRGVGNPALLSVGADVEVHRVALVGIGFSPFVLDGGSALIEQTWIAESPGDAGVTVLGGSLTVRDSLIERTAYAAIDVYDGQVVVERSEIRSVASLDGVFGAGIQTIGLTTATSVELRGSRLSDIEGIALLNGGGRLLAEQIMITDLRAFQGIFGDGLVGTLYGGPSELTMRDSYVARCERAGLAVFGSNATLEGVTFDCNTIHLNGQDFAGASYQVVDGGRNRCGCGDEVACQVLATEIQPPFPPP